MRIKITQPGIFGMPTPENPTGEVPVGSEFKVDSVPAGWAGRYIDLDEKAPAEGEEAEALKAQLAEKETTIEGLNKTVEEHTKTIDDLKAQLAAKSAPAPLKAEHHGGGKFNITQGENVLASGLSKADADAFNGMTDAEKAEYVAKSKSA